MKTETKVLMTALKYRRIFIEELASLTSLPVEIVEQVVRENQDLLVVKNNEVLVREPVEAALKLVSNGVSIDGISSLLNWRDFEYFTMRILFEAGYEVEHGLMITSPVRFEIDVFAVEPATGFTLVVDCKHWSYTSTSRLIEAGETHIKRIEKLIKYYSYVKQKYRIASKARELTPLIITLLTPPIRIHANTLFLSIRELPVFLSNRHYILDYYEVKPIKIPL